MSLRKEYEKDVAELEYKIDRDLRRTAVRLKSSLDDLLPFMFLMVLFVVIFGYLVEVGQKLTLFVTLGHYAVIAYFAARLAVEFKLRSSDQGLIGFVKNHPLDFALVSPTFLLLDEAKLAQLLGRSTADGWAPEAAAGVSLRGTSIAARLTSIARAVKRALRL